MSILKVARLGHPVLRAKAKPIDPAAITSPEVQKLIDDGQGQVVLVKRAIEPGYGKWVFPGGYVDRGELVQRAAVREAREECGLDVRLDGLVDIYSYSGGTPIVIVFAASLVGGDLAVDEEGLEAGWFAPGDVPWGELAFRSTEDALRDFFGGLRHPLRSLVQA